MHTGFYLYSISYVGSPLFGWHVDSASLAAAFGALPFVAKIGLKSLIAMPFTFHSFNGLRHLLWDTTAALHLKSIYATGYAVIGMSIVSAIALVAFL